MIPVDYITKNGRPVRISSAGRLGSGGEGQVMRLQGIHGFVAKIFHQPTPERRAKIECMVAQPLPESHRRSSVAWPRDLLFHSKGNRAFAGYLMAEVKNAWPIFSCYNLLRRRAVLPGFTYRHLVRTAQNLAAVVELIHKNRCVIGDLNESNVLVSSTALATIIDADSIQLTDHRGRIHRCGVGKADFLAPELQARNLATTDRRPCHDTFALGVLVFRLLAEGAHPFDGLWSGMGDPPPLEERMASGVLPNRDRSGNFQPKPLGVPFETIHPAIQHLLIECFERGRHHPESRPDAHTWKNTLSHAERELRVCRSNPHHVYWGGTCTWCNRSALLGGIDPFPRNSPVGATNVRKRVSVRVPVAPPGRRDPWSRFLRFLRIYVSLFQAQTQRSHRP